MDLYYKRSEFPAQKLPLVKKTEPWRKACVDVLISREGSSFVNGRSRKDILKIDYDLYNSVFSEDDFKYVIDPFNVGDSFPAHPQNMNIIKPKIDLLLGEETKRPFNFRVFSTNDESVSQIQDYKKQLLIKEYLGALVEGQDDDEIDKRLSEIDTYIKNKYNTVAEQTAYNSLKYLREQLSIDHEFLKGWKDALIAGEELYYTGIVNGEASLERVNPYHCTYDNDPDLDYIEDGDWFVRRFLMSPGAIYDRFQSTMTEEDLDKLLKMIDGGQSMVSRPGDVNYNSIMYRDKIISDIQQDEFFKGQLVPVWHTCWKSFKKFGTLRYNDLETGQEVEEIVDETYRLTEEDKVKGITIEWDWMTEIWEGYRVGTDIHLDMGPVQYQYQSLEHPKVTKLPYIGCKYNSTNTRNKSLVDLMKPLQYMYIVVWYRLELALARDKGRIINMDITQIPKSMGIDVKQWMHYLSALGVNLINPYEEGWDIPGREGGRPAVYNQMSAQDLTMSAVIADYIGLLDKIEDMAGEISGVSRQRQGQISSNELVGNVQRATIQSSHITEPLFEMHNHVKKRAYTSLLNVAKYAWSTNNKKKLTFIVDDFSRMFLELNDEFLYSDFDIFVSDSSKENQNLEALRSLMQPAIQNGATLSDVVTLLTSDSLSEIKRKLKEIEDNRAKAEQEMQKQQAQMQQQQQQFELQDKAEERRIKEEDSIRKAETAITVAEIQVASKQQPEGPDNINIETDGSEEMKLELQRDKNLADERYKQAIISETVRKNKVDEQLKKQELEIKRKVAMKRPSSK
jgi:hypothetical protein